MIVTEKPLRREEQMKWLRTTRFRWLARPLLAVVATLLALLLAEVSVRLAGLVPDVIAIEVDAEASAFQRSDNPILAYELKSSFRGDSRATGRTDIITNSHGQRDVERSLEKPVGVVRTIVLGDSVVQGVGVTDLNQTISRQLEIELGEPTQEVLNFGVDGYCTRAEIELLETKGLRFSPDQVVLVFVENDFENFNPEIERLATKRPAIINRLFRRSVLFRMVCLQLNLFNFGVETDPHSWNTRAIGDNNVVAGLTRLKQLSLQHQFDVLIAIWPQFRDEGIRDVHEIPGKGELLIERLAGSMQIPTVRLSAYFREHWESTDRKENPRLAYTNGDEMHPSALGCQVAARSLKSILETIEPAGGQQQFSSDQVDREAISLAQALGAKSKPSYYARMVNDAVATEQSVGGAPEAERLYQEAISIRPDLPNAYFNLAVLYERQGKQGAARQQYLLAVGCRPRDLNSHYNLAMLMLRANDFSGAVQYLQQVVLIQPRHVPAHFNLGLIYRHTGEIELARQEFRFILEHYPNHQDAARILRELENSDQPDSSPKER